MINPIVNRCYELGSLQARSSSACWCFALHCALACDPVLVCSGCFVTGFFTVLAIWQVVVDIEVQYRSQLMLSMRVVLATQ